MNSYCNMDESNPSKNEIAHKQGFMDAWDGKKVGDNPHPETSQEHWQWMNGFTLALKQLG